MARGRARRGAADRGGRGRDRAAPQHQLRHSTWPRSRCRWKPGRRVLLSDREFPANVYPWLAMERLRGARVDVHPGGRARQPGRGADAGGGGARRRGDPGRLRRAVHQRVGGGPGGAGPRLPRARHLAGGGCHPGAGPDARGRARVRTSTCWRRACHKWLCAPVRHGVHVRAARAHRPDGAAGDRLDVDDGVGGPGARAGLRRTRWVEGARRFEVATQPWQDYAGMAESLELLLEAGSGAHPRSTCWGCWTRWRRGWRSAGMEVTSDLRPERRSGIFSFRPADAAGAHTRADAGGGGMRGAGGRGAPVAAPVQSA